MNELSLGFVRCSLPFIFLLKPYHSFSSFQGFVNFINPTINNSTPVAVYRRAQGFFENQGLFGRQDEEKGMVPFLFDFLDFCYPWPTAKSSLEKGFFIFFCRYIRLEGS